MRMRSLAATLLVTLTTTLLLAATLSVPAEAVNMRTWSRLAKCESGARWHINTGNGYYGGLQFSPRTWKGFGGKQYASKAHKASKAEQIAIARRVLAEQGAGAWPTCSRRAGLTKKNGGADTNATQATNPGTSPSATNPTPKKKAASSKPATVKTTKVRSGDTIRKIAKRYNVEGGWRGLWQLNKKTVKDPNRIYVGQVLRIR